MRGAWGLIGALVLLAGLGLFVAREWRAPASPRPSTRASAALPASAGPREGPVAPPPEEASPASVPAPAGELEDEERLQVPDEAPLECSLSGRVLDEDGHPLPRVWLGLQREVDGRRIDGVATHEHGRYQVDSLTRHTHTLRVDVRGYVGQEFTTPRLVSGPNTFDITLRRAASVRGTVVDEEGRPVDDVSLSLEGARDPSLRTFGPTSTQEDGSFQMDAPVAGEYIAQLLHPDFLITELPVTAPAERVRLVLRSGLTLEVEVVDEAGRPVRGAQVGAQADEPESYLGEQFPTDEAGRVTLRGFEPGRYVVLASLPSPGHARTVTGRVESKRAEVLRVRLRLEAGLPLSGTVVDGVGNPLEGVELRVAPASLADPGPPEARGADPFRDLLKDTWTASQLEAPLLTGPEGHFSLRSLRPGTWLVSARKEGYALRGSTDVMDSVPAVRVSAGASGVRLVLGFLGIVRGRVVREDGSPVRSFQVGDHGYLNEAGTFRHVIQTPGAQALTFRAEELARVQRTVWVREGEDVDLGDVVLRPARDVAVRIVDAVTSRPVQGARVELLSLAADVPEAERSRREFFTAYKIAAPGDEAEPGEPFTTLSTGRLVLSPVEAQPLLLEVRHPDYQTERVTLGATQLEVEVRLRPGSRER